MNKIQEFVITLKRMYYGWKLKRATNRLNKNYEQLGRKVGEGVLPVMQEWVSSLDTISSDVLTTGKARKRNRNL